jgi:hypothetical protein
LGTRAESRTVVGRTASSVRRDSLTIDQVLVPSGTGKQRALVESERCCSEHSNRHPEARGSVEVLPADLLPPRQTIAHTWRTVAQELSHRRDCRIHCPGG